MLGNRHCGSKVFCLFVCFLFLFLLLFLFFFFVFFILRLIELCKIMSLLCHCFCTAHEQLWSVPVNILRSATIYLNIEVLSRPGGSKIEWPTC